MKTKLLALLLALATLLSLALVACGDPADDSGDSGNAADGTGTGTGDITDNRTNLEIALANYEGIDLEGKVFKILSPDPGSHFYGNSGSAENEVYYEEPSSEALPNAIYYRNLLVSEELGIEIEPVYGGSTDNISNIVKLNDAAGDKEYYDVILNRLDYEITYATSGMLLNFYDITSMNLENAWWDEHIVDTFTIDNSILYTLSGDLNYYDDYAVQIMFFNKELCTAVGYDYPYQLVRDGTWTVDKMTEMALEALYDENGDGAYDPGVDILGVGDNYDVVPHYVFCYDLKMSENDENGVPSIVWPNDINTAVIDEIYNIFVSDYASTNMSASQFMNGKFLFYGEMLGMIPSFRDMQQDFGILPMPKGDESIEGYRAYVSNGWTTAYAIPKLFGVDEAYDIGIILECLSAASADEVTPALYDQLLESKYIRDEESKEMLSYILDSKVYDWAGDLAWATTLRSSYQNVLSQGPSSFTTSVSAIEKAVTKQLERLYSSLTDFN